ncbi:hypothetical protein [Micromonospora sp. WMMD1082]|uniref:hypothetical protein n=1 Tax=Micromonospora sp. WMMD1082 TaxID=3016104 RepID=UPI00241605ED|nr:hypothetical protein [Micromonospora sp. WMMD1082]MDG4795202.1 hypothetical protein [Micromonospora sp. WMMD1082]
MEKARVQWLLAGHEVLFVDSATLPLGDPALRIRWRPRAAIGVNAFMGMAF